MSDGLSDTTRPSKGEVSPLVERLRLEPRPLHVRVAEALGCAPYEHDDHWFCDEGECKAGAAMRYPDGSHHSGDYGALLEYDTDWSATGPLIERYRMYVEPDTCHEPQWLAFVMHDGEAFTVSEGPGSTPLIAVCNLILALKEAGKL